MKKIILCAALTFVTLSGLAVVKINQESSDVKITERPVWYSKISRAASWHIKKQKPPDRAFYFNYIQAPSKRAFFGLFQMIFLKTNIFVKPFIFSAV
ncbi:hypothetical protein phi105_31 [Bacillus phage phi105]|uniref:ORF51 n=1 Tax=Bacillus phage phi105 TaxID=10717 RepID=Q9ZXD2_BPPH1|nr:hypothetical protein phi105_31 [Bacillus phage phi105]BAA36657.1 unnamed protein product [Bacillus phage phi105]